MTDLPRSLHKKRKWWIMEMISNIKAQILHLIKMKCKHAWFISYYSSMLCPEFSCYQFLVILIYIPLTILYYLDWAELYFLSFYPPALKLSSHSEAVHSSFKQKSLEHFKHLLTAIHSPLFPTSPIPLAPLLTMPSQHPPIPSTTEESRQSVINLRKTHMVTSKM